MSYEKMGVYYEGGLTACLVLTSPSIEALCDKMGVVMVWCLLFFFSTCYFLHTRLHALIIFDGVGPAACIRRN
jgi:hypothetical protein